MKRQNIYESPDCTVTAIETTCSLLGASDRFSVWEDEFADENEKGLSRRQNRNVWDDDEDEEDY